ADGEGLDFTTTRVGAMFGLFFSKEKIETYAQATAADRDLFNRFFQSMLEQGVFFAPAAYEAGFMSMAHDESILADTLRAARTAFASLRS
ncbi:MAG: aspartate aminotransferase family protein, partial [Dokdonella sp.]